MAINCCGGQGGLNGDNFCVDDAGGVLRAWITNLCDIAVAGVTRYDDYYPALQTQPTLGPPTYAPPTPGLTDPEEQKQAIYPRYAVRDIIMKPDPLLIAPRLRWYEITFKEGGITVGSELVGGNQGATALYWNHTVALTIPRQNQFVTNRLAELATGKSVMIIETRQIDTKYALEVAALTAGAYTEENRFYLIGGPGLRVATAVNAIGPGVDVLSGWNITMVAPDSRSFPEICADIDSGASTGISGAGKYISIPYIAGPNYGATSPKNNLITKLVLGDV